MKELEGIGATYITRRSMDCLKDAIGAHVNGLYLSSIATSGILAERLTMDLYKQTMINGKPLIKTQLKKFAELTQYQRITILFTLGALKPKSYTLLDQMRKTRNEHTHPSKDNESKQREDSIKMLKITKLFYAGIYPFSSESKGEKQSK